MPSNHPEKFKATLCLDDTEGVGSTDARIIMTGDWQDLYMQKTGQAKRPDLTGEWKPRLGLHTESLHAEWHGRQTGEKIYEPTWTKGKEFARVRLEGKPSHHLVSIDRIVEGKAAELLELKHTHAANTLFDAAHYYMGQLQWQMYMFEQPRIRFSIITGNNEPEWGYVDRDDDYIAKMIETVDTFWEHVTSKTQPEVIASPKSIAAAGAIAKTIKVNGQRDYDMTGDNEWAAAADKFVLDKVAAESLKVSEPAIKGMVPADARVISGAGVTFKRDKRGALRLTLDEDARSYAESKLAALIAVQENDDG